MTDTIDAGGLLFEETAHMLSAAIARLVGA
jgi:hypothetical protein